MKEFFTGLLVLILSLFGGGSSAPAERPAPKGETAAEAQMYPATVTAEVVRVIDGDTIDVGFDGRVERVRYIGIDSPEPRAAGAPECYSAEASAANRELVAGKTVRLEADEELRDEYGRLLRYVYVPRATGTDDMFVNAELLREGYAKLLFIPPNTREYGAFLALRNEARAEGRGLWRCGEQ